MRNLIEKQKIKPVAIAKFSKKKFLKDILEKEELFFNTITYFSKKENENHQFDQYEGINKIYQSNNVVDLKLFDRHFKVKDNGKPIKIRLSSNNYFTHICCFTFFTNEIIEINGERKVFDPQLFEFGNYFIVGIDINEILKIISSACEIDKNIFKWEISPVTYYDVKKINGDWNIFCKPLKYRYQNEIRVAIAINSNKEFKLKVSGIKKYFLDLISKNECINKIIDDVAIITKKPN